MKHTKFVACLLGLGATFYITMVGKMSGDVATALSVICGGYYGANSLITTTSLKNGNGHVDGSET
jgi:hypothetical protein